LAETALKAAKRYKFEPYIRNGRAIKVRTEVPVNVYSDGRVILPDRAFTATPDTPPLGTFLDERVLQRVAPVYPPEAIKSGIQGTVSVFAVIGKDGRPYHLRALDGPEELQRAAIEAVKRWVFEPHRWNGEPVEVGTQVLLDFSLAPHPDSSSSWEPEHRRAIYTIP
jgi:protein TonB